MKRALSLLLLSVSPLACTAKLNGGSGSDANGSGTDPNGPGASGTLDEHVDVTPARLLTDTQYNKAVETLFGDTTRPLTEQVQAQGELYDNDSSALIANPRLVEAFEDAAVRVAARAFETGKAQFDCSEGEEESTCISTFIDELGLKVFRRPPSEQEKTLLGTVFTELRADDIGDSQEAAAEGVLAAMLQMPGFLYQTELGEGPGERSRLSAYEVASRLAFALTNAPPDDTLLEAAQAGDLDTPDGVREQAKRLLATDASQTALFHFAEQWLGIEGVANINRDETLYPDYTTALGEAMHEETRRFFAEVFYKQNGDVADLFTADFSFVDDKLAELYGMSGEFGSDFTRVTLPEERRGVLTQASYLAAHSVSDRTSPVQRGVYTNRKIMCNDLPPPPNNVGALPAKVEEGGSVRDQLAAHSANPCASCHKLIDPVGLSLENYDAIGGYRTEYENGVPVDATGNVLFADDEVPVDGGTELSSSIAAADSTVSCFTRQLMTYMLGRTTSRDDGGTIERISGQTQNLQEIVLEIVSSETFLYRNVPAPEACE
jgi:hypothetical protein